MQILHEVAGTPPVLLVHSALGTHKEMIPLAESITDRTVYVLDLPAHGANTFVPSEYTSAELGRWLLRELEQYGIRSVDVVGYSLGAYVAVGACLLEADTVAPIMRSLVCHAMKFYWTPEAVRASVSSLDYELVSRRSGNFISALDAAHTVGARLLMGAVSNLITRLDTDGLSTESVKPIRTRILLTTGELDTMVPPEEVRRLAQHVECEAVVLEGVSHAIKTLDVKRYQAILDHYWRSLAVIEAN